MFGFIEIEDIDGQKGLFNIDHIVMVTKDEYGETVVLLSAEQSFKTKENYESLGERIRKSKAHTLRTLSL